MLELVEKDDVKPVCPHCEERLEEIWFQEIRSYFGKRFLYVCPSCEKCLGISHRKGFWMG